jgi:hypothetical protein
LTHGDTFSIKTTQRKESKATTHSTTLGTIKPRMPRRNGRFITPSRCSSLGLPHSCLHTYSGGERFALIGGGIDGDFGFGSFFGYGHDWRKVFEEDGHTY